MRRSTFLLAGIGVWALSGGGDVHAAGSIVAIDATIAAGDGQPTGRTIVDPAAAPRPAPVFEARQQPPSLGSFSGTMPALPDAGSGASAFVAASDATLSAGTHDFASFQVDPGVTVTCTGPVTIRTTGAATIAGRVASTAGGASIAFVCGGEFAMTSGATGTGVPAVDASGAGASIAVDALQIRCAPATGRDGRIAAPGGVALRHHGEAATAQVYRMDVDGGGGGAALLSAGAIDLASADFSAAGAVDVRAYDGTLVAWTSTFAGAAARIESLQRLSLNGGAVTADDSIGLASFAERVLVNGTTVQTGPAAAGDLDVRAAAHVELQNATILHRGTGAVRVFARDGDVIFERPGSTRRVALAHEGTGDVELMGVLVILYGGGTSVSAAQGDVRMHAVFVEADGDIAVSAPEGLLDVNVGNGLTLRRDLWGGPTGEPSLDALGIRLTSARGASISVERAVSGTGGIVLATKETATVRGNFFAGGPLRVATLGARLDVAGALLLTSPLAGAGSAPVRVENFAGDAGSIDATGAHIRSGNAGTQASGDVTVVVTAPGVAPGPDPDPDPDPDPSPSPPVFVDGCVLVERASLRRANDPERAVLTITGTLDTGATAGGLEGAVDVTVGDTTRTADLARARRGALRFSNPSLRVSLRESAIGSSRVRFRLRRVGPVGAFLDAAGTGQVDVRLRKGALDADAAIALRDGRYRAGRPADSLYAPRVGPVALRVHAAEGADDALDLTLAYATLGMARDTAPEFSLAFGDRFTVSLPASSFERDAKGRFVAEAPGNGVERVIVDPGRGTLRVLARGVEIGSYPGDASVPFDVVLGLASGDTRYLRLRLGRAGAGRLDW